MSVKPLLDNTLGAEPTAVPATALCDDGTGHCQLCGDDALIGAVISIDSNNRTAVVVFEQTSATVAPELTIATVALEQTMATVALDLIDANVGDCVLVHMGFAIERVESS